MRAGRFDQTGQRCAGLDQEEGVRVPGSSHSEGTACAEASGQLGGTEEGRCGGGGGGGGPAGAPPLQGSGSPRRMPQRKGKPMSRYEQRVLDS